MYKLAIALCLVAAAAAAPAPGLVAPAVYGAAPAVYGGSPWGLGLGHGVYGAAPLYGAPVVKAALPVATSYANTVRVASPVAYAAPSVAYAAPAVHAPLVASPWAGGLAAPWAGGYGAPALAHGW